MPVINHQAVVTNDNNNNNNNNKKPKEDTQAILWKHLCWLRILEFVA